MLRHEMVHVEQIRRLGWFRFYASYLYEFGLNYWRYRNWKQAYFAISFEREAYFRQSFNE